MRERSVEEIREKWREKMNKKNKRENNQLLLIKELICRSLGLVHINIELAQTALIATNNFLLM